MALNLLPSLAVHCWGGLGSQLYAWALIEDLKAKYPHRKVRLILHQSGVTKRVEEIALFFPGEVLIRADFQNDKLKANKHIIVKRKIFFDNLKIFLIKILHTLRIFSNCNNDTNLDSVKFWTIQIRGHYSYRAINLSTVLAMDNRSKHFSKFLVSGSGEINDGVAIQYRLGDLLTLGTKGPIESSRIMNVLRLISTNSEFSRVVLYSDSPSEALRRIQEFPTEEAGAELSTWDTLNELELFKYFVGTNSKISIWAIIIRTYFFPELFNFAPQEFRKQFTYNLGHIYMEKPITFY